MIELGYIIEQIICGFISIFLFIAFVKQIRQDNQIDSIVETNDADPSNIILFKKINTPGYAKYLLHVGGTIGSIILILRSIDPYSVLGIFPYYITDLLSHAGIAFLLIIIFEGIYALFIFLYMYINSFNSDGLYNKLVRVCTISTILISIATWIIENFVDSHLYYSSGIFIMHNICIQWIILWLYHKTLENVKSKLSINILFMENNSIRNKFRHLVFIRTIFLVINILLTTYEIYIVVKYFLYSQTIDDIRIFSDLYSPISDPFYVIQVIAYMIILYFSYISADKIGEITSFSENKQNNSGQVEEVIVKVKEYEMKEVPLEMQTTKVHIRNQSTDDNSSDHIINNTIRSNLSSDNSGPTNPQEFQQLMALIAQQDTAENEGNLETTIQLQEDYITRQREELEGYARHVSLNSEYSKKININ